MMKENLKKPNNIRNKIFEKKHKGLIKIWRWNCHFFFSLNCLVVHCRMRWMPRSDTSGHLVPDRTCVQLLKLVEVLWCYWNSKQPVVYGCLVISNHFPVVKIWEIIQLKQPFFWWFLSGSRFQVPAMIMNDPRLRKHPELFEAKIPTSWVAPELLEAWAADADVVRSLAEMGVKLRGRENFGTKNSDAVYLHTYIVSIVNVHIWSLRPDGPTPSPKNRCDWGFTGLIYSPNKTCTLTLFIFLFTPSIH